MVTRQAASTGQTPVLCDFCFKLTPAKDLAAHLQVSHSQNNEWACLDEGHKIKWSSDDPFGVGPFGKSLVSYRVRVRDDEHVSLFVHWRALTVERDLFIGWVCHATDHVDCQGDDFDFTVQLNSSGRPDKPVKIWTGAVLPFSPYFEKNDAFHFTRTDLKMATRRPDEEGNWNLDDKTYSCTFTFQKVEGVRTLPAAVGIKGGSNSQINDAKTSRRKITLSTMSKKANSWSTTKNDPTFGFDGFLPKSSKSYDLRKTKKVNYIDQEQEE